MNVAGSSSFRIVSASSSWRGLVRPNGIHPPKTDAWSRPIHSEGWSLQLQWRLESRHSLGNPTKKAPLRSGTRPFRKNRGNLDAS